MPGKSWGAECAQVRVMQGWRGAGRRPWTLSQTSVCDAADLDSSPSLQPSPRLYPPLCRLPLSSTSPLQVF